MYAEVAWVLVSSQTQVQPQVILNPGHLPDYLSVSYGYETISKPLKTTTIHPHLAKNHQETTINHQKLSYKINLFQILIIHFFSKLEPRQSLADVNKHQCLTLLCNLIIHTLCNLWHISHYLFLFNQRLPWLRATVV